MPLKISDLLAQVNLLTNGKTARPSGLIVTCSTLRTGLMLSSSGLPLTPEVGTTELANLEMVCNMKYPKVLDN